MSKAPHALAALLCAALALPAAARAESPFAGLWRGTWTDSARGQSGTASLGIGPDGNVLAGVLRNDAAGSRGPLSGGVSDDGKTALTWSCDGGKTSVGIRGQLHAGGGKLTGEADFLGAGGEKVGHGTLSLSHVSLPVPDAPAKAGK